MKMKSIVLLTAALALAPAFLGHTQTLEISALPSEVGPLPAAPGEVLELDLTGAYQIALSRNLDLHVGRYDIAIADTNVRGSGGIFDPYLRASIDGDSASQPTSTILEGANVAESRNTRFNLGVQQLLPSGT